MSLTFQTCLPCALPLATTQDTQGHHLRIMSLSLLIHLPQQLPHPFLICFRQLCSSLFHLPPLTVLIRSLPICLSLLSIHSLPPTFSSNSLNSSQSHSNLSLSFIHNQLSISPLESLQHQTTWLLTLITSYFLSLFFICEVVYKPLSSQSINLLRHFLFAKL